MRYVLKSLLAGVAFAGLCAAAVAPAQAQQRRSILERYQTAQEFEQRRTGFAQNGYFVIDHETCREPDGSALWWVAVYDHQPNPQFTGGFGLFIQAGGWTAFQNEVNQYAAQGWMLEDLDAATPADAQAFFNEFYAPANAVLTVTGDIDVVEAKQLVEKHFGDIPARPAPVLPSFDEPDLTAERRAQHHDPMAPMPAVALAWRTPDPMTAFDDYLVYVLLAEVLTDGDASRLIERMMLKDGIATSLAGYVGIMGEPFEVRGPAPMILQIHYPPSVTTDTIIGVVDEELTRLATDGIDDAELDRVRARLITHLVKESDAVLGRALLMTSLEQQRGQAELINEIPALLARITPAQIVEAAATLRPERRAVLELIPGGGEQVEQ